MTYIDELLLKIVNSSSIKIENLLSRNDSKILRSMASTISGNLFITENQSKLLSKILSENVEKLPEFSEEIKDALKDNLWSQRFRQVEQKRKFYIGKDEDQDSILVVEFSFNSQIRKILQNLSKNLEEFQQRNSGKEYRATLTEKNIVSLTEALRPLNFEIDARITNHYQTIKSWSKSDFLGDFSPQKLKNKFQEKINIDLSTADKNILLDRSIRYQYFLDSEKTGEKNLIDLIVNRKNPRIWVDKNRFSLQDVFVALQQLTRQPTMVVFDNATEEKTLKNLENLEKSLTSLNLDANVGIYFRLQNTETGTKFNKIIANRNFNKQLDHTTKIVGVQSGKIPKFFLKSNWQPMSVIVLDSVMGMRHGKTAIYTNCCDLIIEYADEPAIRDLI